MENCEHETHHDDCCVCWFKQANNKPYDSDIPLFMDKMAAVWSNKDWHTYCMEKALDKAKEAVDEYVNLSNV